MTPETDRPTHPDAAVFEWHPDYAGRTLAKVTRDLESEIARDQRSYEIALMGAEESEHDALASVVDVERRWSPYHFGWNDADPAQLAQRIAAFEWEREQRREMISWQEYRNGNGGTSSASGERSDWRASMSDEQRRKVANGLAAAVIGLIVIAIIVVVVLVL